MKFATLVTFLAAGAMANQQLSQRDIKTITDLLSTIKSDLQGLDTAVKSYGPDKQPLLDALNKLLTDMKDGKAKVGASEQLTLTDAVTLTGPVQELTKVGQGLADDLNAQKPQVEKLGECKLVASSISSISTDSEGLINAVVSKVPPEARDIANQLAGGLTALLKKSQDSFSDQNCKNSGGSSPSSAPGGGASSAPAGSSSSAPATSSLAAPTKPVTTPTATLTGAPSSTPVVVTAGATVLAPAGLFAALVALLQFV